MKKIVSVFVFLTLSVLCLDARRISKNETTFREFFPYKYEVRVSWGGTPMYDAEAFSNGIFQGMGTYDYYEPQPGHAPELGEMYGISNGPDYMTGLISAEFNFDFRHWFSLAIEAGVNGMWGKRYDKYDGSLIGTERGLSFLVMPHARFYWANKKYVRFYTSLGIGLGLGKYDGYFEMYPTVQYTPVGMTAGKKVFFFAEWSVGTSYFGGKAGVGYRF